ncbi:UNVERIFIED_CONTAM: hypothetical protein FKN15_029420 [Acipenser sinensis]
MMCGQDSLEEADLGVKFRSKMDLVPIKQEVLQMQYDPEQNSPGPVRHSIKPEEPELDTSLTWDLPRGTASHCAFGSFQIHQSFSQLPSFRVNQQTHPRQEAYSCTQHGFFQLSSHVKRKRNHEGQKTCLCPECGKTFSLINELKIHLRIHTGEKPYHCSECGKSFNQSGNLKTHQRIHTQEKPYHCPECGKSFTQITNLKNHLLTHTGDKPHQCTECGKNFTQLINLKIHQRIHTGEKPYSCSECGKRFAQLSNLKNHQQKHTGVKPHQCTECGKGFSTLRYFKKHQQNHARERR